MILWTEEKAGAIVSVKNAGLPIMHIFWWAAYMNAFFLGFKVEGRRQELA